MFGRQDQVSKFASIRASATERIGDFVIDNARDRRARQAKRTRRKAAYPIFGTPHSV